MNKLNDEVNNFDFCHCVYREGFVFTCVTEPANILDSIVIRNPEKCDCWSPKKSFSKHSLDEHIAFINKHKIKKAVVIAEDLSFITQCPSLEYIEIIPADSSKASFDYSPLYLMPKIKYLSCATKYGGASEPYATEIDYSRIQGLTEIRINGLGHINISKLNTLRILNICKNKSICDIEKIGNYKTLKSLSFVNNGIKTLSGINQYNDLQLLSLEYEYAITDISQISQTADSLRVLHIENCPKLNDFSFLHKMKNLEHLYLFGKNELPDLSFLSSMKNLQTFSFSMKINDGDLSSCLKIPYVHSENNRKNYNFHNRNLPKNIPIAPFKII